MPRIADIKIFSAAVLLFVLAVVLYAPVIFSDTTFFARDNYAFHNPRRFFAADTAGRGELPLWNPYVGCGTAFQASLQSSVFYPFSMLYYVLPFQKGFKYFIVLHYFLAALNMYLLMRGWKSDRAAAFFSAMVFAFGGYLTSINNNVSFLTAGVWLPLVLLCHHRALKTGRVFYSLLTGCIIALQVFAGDASLYLLASIGCVFIYTLLWPFMNDKPLQVSRPKAWGLLGLGLLTAPILAAVQLLPFFEFVGSSRRLGGLGFDEVTVASFHPLEMVQLVLPHIFGGTMPMTRWFGQYWLDTVYMGLIPLFFAAVFIIYASDRLKLFLVAIAAAAVCLSFGKYNPLYYYLYSYVPGADMIKFPVKFFFIAGFAFAVMAGKGLGCFRACLRRRQNINGMLRCCAVFFVAASAVFVSVSLWRNELFHYYSLCVAHFDPAATQQLRRSLFEALRFDIARSAVLSGTFLLLLVLALKQKISGRALVFCIALLTYADLALTARTNTLCMAEEEFFRENPTAVFLKQDPSVFRVYSLAWLKTGNSFLHVPDVPFEKTYRRLQDAFHHNLGMYHHIQSAGEYSSVLNMRFQDVFHPVRTFFKLGGNSGVPQRYCRNILNLLNIKYIISLDRVDGLHLRLVRDGDVKIYQNPDVLPRAFLIKNLKVVQDEGAVLSALRRPEFSPSREAYIAETEAQRLRSFFASDRAGVAAAGVKETDISITHYGVNTVELHVRAPRPGLVVVADNYYPGWKAFGPEGEIPLVRVNYTVRGMPVIAGEQHIRMVFRPASLTWGALVSLLGLVLAGIGLIASRRRGAH